MITPLDHAKASMRERLRDRVRNLPATERSTASTAICSRLRKHPVWSAAGSVLLFAPMANEPDIWPLLAEALAAGKTVALPAFVTGTNTYAARRIVDPLHDLVTGKFAIREPAPACPEVPLNRLDLVLVPGIAFDARGARLGRGQGYYDRLLAVVRGTKCGVAYEEQIVASVPVGPQDIYLHCILTPTRWIET